MDDRAFQRPRFDPPQKPLVLGEKILKVNASTKTILVTFFWGLFWGLFFSWRLFWRLFIQKIVAKLKIVPKIVSKQKMNLKITLWASSHQCSPGRCVHLSIHYYDSAAGSVMSVVADVHEESIMASLHQNPTNSKDSVQISSTPNGGKRRGTKTALRSPTRMTSQDSL